jgi:alanine dehydrogenase
MDPRVNKRIETLILTRNDVESIFTVKDCIDVVEQAFKAYGEGKVTMLPKSHIHFEEGSGIFAVMSAYIKSLKAVGAKIGTGHPNNPSRFGLPLVMATMILNDPMTGVPLAIMDATYLTAVRTAAAGAVAAKYLSRKDSKIVSIIGTGTQGRFQLEGILNVRNVEEVQAYDISYECSLKYAKDVSRKFDIKATPFKTVEKAVLKADIIVTATPSKSPILMDEWINLGTHINAMGADAEGKQELDPKILKRSKIVVDNRDQSIRIGELNIPFSKGIILKEDIYADIGEIVAGKKSGRTSETDITVFDSSGLPIQDVAVAKRIYDYASKKAIGRKIKLM